MLCFRCFGALLSSYPSFPQRTQLVLVLLPYLPPRAYRYLFYHATSSILTAGCALAASYTDCVRSQYESGHIIHTWDFPTPGNTLSMYPQQAYRRTGEATLITGLACMYQYTGFERSEASRPPLYVSYNMFEVHIDCCIPGIIYM